MEEQTGEGDEREALVSIDLSIDPFNLIVPTEQYKVSS